MKKVREVFKIKNTKTGKYSKGGTSKYDFWVDEDKGKEWVNIGSVKSHLSQFVNYKGGLVDFFPYDEDCIIEKLEIIIEKNEIDSVSVMDLVSQKIENVKNNKK